MAQRLEFTDKQKAEIFVLDRATCAFSGKSLWVLDYDLCPTYDVDWVDHIKPATRGGDNSIENGVCASSFFNAKKKDNSHDNLYFFFRGEPTKYFWQFYEFLPERISQNLKRFERLHWTDWYANRALWMFMIALEYRYNPYLKNGQKQKRDDVYYAKACLKRALAWQRMVEAENIEAIQERGLVPTVPSPEQKLLLSVLESSELNEVTDLLDQAFPSYEANCEVFLAFTDQKPIAEKSLAACSGRMIRVTKQKRI